MTPDKLYEAGYNDGKAGKAMNASWMTDPDYMMGYEDGKGDYNHDRPVSEEYTALHDPPEGFEFTGEKRVPYPYEYYLSKGGNASYLTRPRKNNQTRHILRCKTCGHSKGESCYDHPEVKGRG